MPEVWHVLQTSFDGNGNVTKKVVGGPFKIRLNAWRFMLKEAKKDDWKWLDLVVRKTEDETETYDSPPDWFKHALEEM